eukprot:CAMPEP_0185031700 /NCGR_PEP_ID=MMETSP1103-20130426/19316_1 /TAXON_ID=36769 /ORGANISM="Paraphysomonas bandaiensis, Strain Caron Lab Isolate" /LENGTH=910 /DNA_ID=CAMNT_0027567315 /DNA_START=111 /DNA_END=2843 /DNA_ORIENTATION=-
MALRILPHLLLVATATANVIGIDFGSDNMKVGLVSPGKFDIVTNSQSKRRTPNSITFYNGERSFGADSYALMARKPELTFTKFHRILGQSHDSPLVASLQKQYFPYVVYANETTGLTSIKFGESYFTPEELLAMMMMHAKEMTKQYGGKNVKDCVLTVPSSFTQHERAAMYAAADIADLNVLSLMEENTAAALHFGIDRVFDDSHTVLFYNMGASMVQVSIVTYSSYETKEGGKNKTVGQFQVIGKAWDTQLGGVNFDVVIAEILADRFNANWHKKKSGKGQDIRDHVRPMTRLRMEAMKIREVLSANNEFPYKVEQLHADVDLHTKITRSEFEEACGNLFDRVTHPIDEALAMAGMTLKDINAVELIGGGVRMPKVKQNLEAYFRAGDLELGAHLNGDEAMALGAAFRAANISTAFRVRKIGMSDISKFGVSINLESLPTASDGGVFGWLVGKTNTADNAANDEAWAKHTALYPAGSAVPSKTKTVAFHHDQDILCKVEYDRDDSNPLPEGTDHMIALYNVTGVSNFAKMASERGLGTPKVHLSFTLDASGMVYLSKAEATLELPAETEESASTTEEESVAETQSNESSAESVPLDEAAHDTKVEEPTPKESSDDKSTKNKKSKKSKKDNTLRQVLTIDANTGALRPAMWSSKLLADARRRLEDLNAADELRLAKAAALNDLEAFVYKIRGRFREEDGDDKLGAVSTDEQREDIIAMCDDVEDWLYGDGRDQDVSVYKARQNAIKVKADAVFKRFKEHKARPEAVRKARTQLATVRKVVAEWSESLPHVTEEEKEKLLNTVGKVETWLDDNEKAQLELSSHETPAFSSADVTAQMKPLTLQFEKLLKKPKPVPPKVNVTASLNETNTTTVEQGDQNENMDPVNDGNATESEFNEDIKDDGFDTIHDDEL